VTPYRANETSQSTEPGGTTHLLSAVEVGGVDLNCVECVECDDQTIPLPGVASREADLEVADRRPPELTA
jgi:hypothetical protein